MCECTYTNLNYNTVSAPKKEVVHIYPESTKRVAKINCESHESRIKSEVVKCELK